MPTYGEGRSRVSQRHGVNYRRYLCLCARFGAARLCPVLRFRAPRLIRTMLRSERRKSLLSLAVSPSSRCLALHRPPHFGRALPMRRRARRLRDRVALLQLAHDAPGLLDVRRAGGLTAIRARRNLQPATRFSLLVARVPPPLCFRPPNLPSDGPLHRGSQDGEIVEAEIVC